MCVQILVPLVVVAACWILSRNSTSVYFPSLTRIFRSFAETWTLDRVGSDVIPSLRRLVAGYFLAGIIGIFCGVALGLSRRLRRNTEPILEFIRAIPPPALIPLAILLFGIGDMMKLAVIVVGSLWPVLLNTIDGVKSVEDTKLQVGRVYHLSAAQRIRYIVLPSALPQIFSGLRTSLAITIILMVISEMVASTNGIGYFVLQSQRTFQITEMWTGIILLGCLGYALSLVFGTVERRVLHWYFASRG